MLRCLIIDDEMAGINVLRMLIEQHPSILRLVASATEAQEGVRLIDNYRPELVFLDISMPGMSGFDLLECVSYTQFHLVFTTAHRDYAIKALRKKAFDYLLKPIDPLDFKVMVENLAKLQAPSENAAAQNVIDVQVRDGIEYIRLADIIRLEADGSYTIIYLDDNRRVTASRGIKTFEATLDATLFCRCHNSHIVNLQKVRKFINHNGFFAQMTDGSRVEISRRTKDHFLERLKGI